MKRNLKPTRSDRIRGKRIPAQRRTKPWRDFESIAEGSELIFVTKVSIISSDPMPPSIGSAVSRFDIPPFIAQTDVMNLAILIGVASYKRPVADLPACDHDVGLMSRLLQHTNKFPNTLELRRDTSSAEVKTALAQFISKFKDEPVDELFFYFSGHGDLFKDDFYFLFSDFDEKRRNQTSLTNDELDSMLKTLSPKLMIKVVDACHAGVAYVKEPDALAKQLQKGNFSDCYFMFSSQSSQSSLQDTRLSDFTEAFVEACATFTGQDIRYKDIVDHIADAFAGNPDQTPTFVIQAPCVELFCTIDDTIRALLPSRSGTTIATSLAAESSGSKMSEAIKAHAAQFATRQEVSSFIARLGDRLNNATFTSELRDSYKLVGETSDGYQGIPGLGSVGQWVKENGTDFFAKPTYATETYEAPEDDYLGLRLAFEPRKMVKKKREVIAGFDCTAETPFKSVRITAYPNYENLQHAVAVIVFVFSKKECVLFYIFQTVKELDWGKLAGIEPRKWSYTSVVMKSDPEAAKTASELMQRFESFLTKSAKERLGLVEETKEAQPKLAQADPKKKKE